jgi:hypothetical protein
VFPIARVLHRVAAKCLPPFPIRIAFLFARERRRRRSWPSSRLLPNFPHQTSSATADLERLLQLRAPASSTSPPDPVSSSSGRACHPPPRFLRIRRQAPRAKAASTSTAATFPPSLPFPLSIQRALGGPGPLVAVCFLASPARKSAREAVPRPMFRHEARPQHGPAARRALPSPARSGRAWPRFVPGRAGRPEWPSIAWRRIYGDGLDNKLLSI